jgi:hypothetical protein
LESYERPDVNSNRKTSGETNGWIGEHKRLLKELGATVIWNNEERKYELKKDKVQLIDTNERKKTKVQLDGIDDHPNKEDMEWFLNNYKEEFIAADVDWKSLKHEGLIQKGYNFRTKSSNISLIFLFCKEQQDALIIAKANFPIIDGLQKAGVNGGVLFVAQGDDQYNVRDILGWFAGEENVMITDTTQTVINWKKIDNSIYTLIYPPNWIIRELDDTEWRYEIILDSPKLSDTSGFRPDISLTTMYYNGRDSWPENKRILEGEKEITETRKGILKGSTTTLIEDRMVKINSVEFHKFYYSYINEQNFKVTDCIWMNTSDVITLKLRTKEDGDEQIEINGLRIIENFKIK